MPDLSDKRMTDAKDTHTVFPAPAFANAAELNARREELRFNLMMAAGLYPDVQSAIAAMHAHADRVYTPNGAKFAVYSALYEEYRCLHDYFGRGENGVMARLRAISAKQKGN